MKITFEQTTEDLLDLSKNNIQSNRLLKILVAVLIGLLLINMTIQSLSPDFQWEKFLSFFIPAILIMTLFFFLFRFFVRKQISHEDNQKLLVGMREIEFLDEEIHVKTPHSETTYQWSAVTRLSESEKNFFLYMGRSIALIVPKRAFEDDLDRGKFEALIRSKIQKFNY